jgi:hypothetical protein
MIMYGEEVAIVAIVFGSVLAIVFMGIVGSIIKAAIKRKSGSSLSENKEFLAALREFKEKTDRRLSNLEAIAAGDESPSLQASKKASKKALPAFQGVTKTSIRDGNRALPRLLTLCTNSKKPR